MQGCVGSQNAWRALICSVGRLFWLEIHSIYKLYKINKNIEFFFLSVFIKKEEKQK
jgi:hypothetical protein